MDRFAGDHAGDGGAMVHGVSVHHPCHHFAIGADVRRRNIFLRPDNNADFAGVTAGQTLQFTFRQGEGVDADAAFGPAVRNIDRGALNGHPGRKCHDFVKIDIRMVANTTFTRSARQIVLNAIALEVADGAVVHLHRNVDDQRALLDGAGFPPSRQDRRDKARRGRSGAGRWSMEMYYFQMRKITFP